MVATLTDKPIVQVIIDIWCAGDRVHVIRSKAVNPVAVESRESRYISFERSRGFSPLT
jgi:hypothetical protein